MSEEYPNIACSDLKIAKALSRYLKFRFGFEKTLLNPLKDPYRFRDAVEMAEESDFLIVDAFIDGAPKGFHFARQLGKKTLLLFYPGALGIEHEGPFWLVLPYKLDRLKDKIIDISKKPKITDKKYLDLENKYPLLKEFKRHHF